MKFSFGAFFLTLSLVVLSGAVSFAEGTFTNKKVTMGFMNHGGMWGDLILLSCVAGLVFPFFVKSRLLIMASLFLALALTIVAHVQWGHWARTDGVTEHMFRGEKTGNWRSEMTAAGWMHVVVMTFLLATCSMYVLSSTPGKVVILVSFLLTIHVFVATVQPGWYCTGKFWTWRNFGPPLFASGLIWTVAAFKIAKRSMT
jgi:hypothetical protein